MLLNVYNKFEIACCLCHQSVQIHKVLDHAQQCYMRKMRQQRSKPIGDKPERDNFKTIEGAGQSGTSIELQSVGKRKESVAFSLAKESVSSSIPNEVMKSKASIDQTQSFSSVPVENNASNMKNLDKKLSLKTNQAAAASQMFSPKGPQDHPDLDETLRIDPSSTPSIKASIQELVKVFGGQTSLVDENLKMHDQQGPLPIEQLIKDKKINFDKSFDIKINIVNNGGFTYSGQIDKEERMNGIGRQQFSDQFIYEGELKQDQKHGYGRQIWGQGSSYTGQFKENFYNGFGKLINPDGTI